MPVVERFVCVQVWRPNQHSPRQRCTAPPVWGTAYCERHRGQAQGRAARARASQADDVAGASLALLTEAGVDMGYLGELGVLTDPPPRDPGEVLLEEVARCAAIIKWLEGEIEELSKDELFEQEVETSTVENKQSQGTGPGSDSYYLDKTERHRQVHTYWQLLQSERKLLQQATTAALKSNIEERRIRLAERGVGVLEAAVAAALLELGLDPNSERVREVVGRRMREALEAGGTGGIFLGTQTHEDHVPAFAHSERVIENAGPSAEEF